MLKVQGALRLRDVWRGQFTVVGGVQAIPAASIRHATSRAGFAAGPAESLAKVCARATGLTSVELRGLLERWAAGLPVE